MGGFVVIVAPNTALACKTLFIFAGWKQ